MKLTIIWAVSLIILLAAPVVFFHQKARHYDPIPRCPECVVGTNRMYVDTKTDTLRAPLVYNDKGDVIMQTTYMRVAFWKCLICETEYGWYTHKYFGEGYHDPNQVFKLEM